MRCDYCAEEKQSVEEHKLDAPDMGGKVTMHVCEDCQ